MAKAMSMAAHAGRWDATAARRVSHLCLKEVCIHACAHLCLKEVCNVLGRIQHMRDLQRAQPVDVAGRYPVSEEEEVR